jgi:hypothetical protein
MRWLAAARPSSKRENAMRVGIALALIALAYSVDSYSAPAIAQHHASKQKAEKPKTDAELIASAMSAAPLAVSKDATIVAVGSDGKLRTLRQGQGALRAFLTIRTRLEMIRCA